MGQGNPGDDAFEAGRPSLGVALSRRQLASRPEKPGTKPERLLDGDLWGAGGDAGGLPSAIAFGVTIFSPWAQATPAQGRWLASSGPPCWGWSPRPFGGTDRLITAPCARRGGVLVAVAIDPPGRVGAEPGMQAG